MTNNNFFILIFGIIFSQKIIVVGEIYVGELISLVYVFFNLFNLKYSDFEKKLISYTIFIVIFLFLLNFYHGTDIDKSLKGSFSYITFTTCIIYLLRYLGKFEDFKKPILFFIGLILGRFVFLFYSVDFLPLFLYNPWKFGIGISIIQFCLIIPLFYKKHLPIKFWLFFVSIIIYISFANNTRGLPFILILAFVPYILFFKSRKRSLKFFNKKRTFMLLPLLYFFIVMFSGLIIAKINPINSSSVVFEKMAEKNIKQSQGSFGVTLSARSPLLDAFYAIKDRPFLGHGSYPKDKDAFYRMKGLEFLYKYDYIDTIPNPKFFERFFELIINGHSVLFDSMVSAGLLGAVFWIFITFFIVKNYANYAHLLPFFFHFLIGFFIYSLFFDPWSSSTRHAISITIVFLIIFINLLNKNK
jgi:hypothetical protein